MSVVRWIAAAAILAGAAVGSWIDSGRATTPVSIDGYSVLAADFHVHAFPGDGALPSWELAREASRRGLHAIVVSNHNQTIAAHVGRRFHPDGLPMILSAQEVTTPGFHLVAAGITRTIDWRLPEADMLREIHDQGGVVIAAHPTARFWKGSDALLAGLDGAEVAHPITESVNTAREDLTAFFARARAVNPDIAPIGSSDFHMVAPLGICRTYVFAHSVTAQGILDAIRAGRTVAQDQNGVLYGDQALTVMLNQSGATTPRPAPTRFALLSGLLVLIGFATAVIWR